MPTPINSLASQAQRRAQVVRTAALVQRPAEPPAATGSDHLPEVYDRDAVQVALDGIVSRFNEQIAGVARRGQ